LAKFILYRILGNDLPPRHTRDQALRNAQFILEHEPAFPDCEKRWVVNRIADREQESKILSLLERHGQHYIHIPFVLDEYAQCRYDIDGLPQAFFLHRSKVRALHPYLREKALEYPFRHKNLYAMNINGARNAALEEGRSLAEWIMPWDGGCFATKAAWDALLRDMESLRDEKYLIVPMARVYDNRSLLDTAFVPDQVEEPQIAFHRDAVEHFDEHLRYGHSEKAELLRRLRVPGPWDEWKGIPWDPQGLKNTPEAGKYRHAGCVTRLFSGLPNSKDDNLGRHSHRINGIVSKLSNLDEQALRRTFHSDHLVFYDESVLSEHKRVWLEGGKRAADPVGNLLCKAESVLGEGPYSVLHKTALPPGGDAHDYLSPAAHLQRNTLPPEARLYSQESDRYDRTRWQLVMNHTTLLALAWYFTGDSRFADRAALLIRTWFLDPATRMNPHLKYAQIRLGEEDEQQGNGLIETNDLYYFLDAVRLISRTGALSLPEQRQFRQWCREFLGWLLSSAQGRRIFPAPNHPGTFFDLQVASLAAFLDDAQKLLWILRISSMRSVQQFQPDGSQPEELQQTNSLHCCVFNLYGWFYLDKLAVLAGMDVWQTRTQAGGNPAAGLSWILSFRPGEWPYRQEEEFDDERLTLLRYLACSPAPDSGRRSDAAVTGTQGMKAVFHPDAGVLPYWPLVSGGRKEKTSCP